MSYPSHPWEIELFSITYTININKIFRGEDVFMTQLKDGYSTRPATKDDIEILADLYNEYSQAMTGVVKFTLEDLENIFSIPGFDIESSLMVVLSPQGEIVASGLVTDMSAPPLHPGVFGCVRKGCEGQGLGTYVIDWAEKRARQAIERCPDHARVSMYLQTAPSHEPTVQLFEKKGLKPVRYSWIMMKDLEQIPPQPKWPKGIQIKTFADFNQLETVLKAVDEAFEDHWGYVDRSGDAERMNRIRHQIENDSDFDASLWILAMDGDEIAGVSLCSPKLGPDRETGMVDTLGVRRPWRRKGMGLALLHYSFGEFLNRGYKRVGLGVDAQNLSGATRLYKKAGMDVAREFVLYEKELRSGEELSKQSL
jgi:GNAT superfamily N-acetyltransferase